MTITYGECKHQIKVVLTPGKEHITVLDTLGPCGTCSNKAKARIETWEAYLKERDR